MLRNIVIKSIQNSTGIKDIEVFVPENEDFGDFSTNIAMVLAKKKDKDLKVVSGKLLNSLQNDNELERYFKKIDLVGGFINFWIKDELLIDELKAINLKKDMYGREFVGKDKVVVIDYSAPNIAKRFSIGHLRSTIIGQALYNLYDFLGYKVIGDNHLGDWGTQFGVLLAEIEIQKANVDRLSIDDLEKMYVNFHKRQENDPKLHNKAKEWFKKLEEGDKKARKIWNKTIELSLNEFNKIYDLLGVKIDYAYGESFYEDKMVEVVQELKEKGITKKSKGAWIVEYKDLPPAMILKSDGTTTYFTRDLATIKYRLANWNPDIFIYEVGSDQTLHFRQLFEAVRLLGWIKNQELKHVGHGLYRLKEGKMSTRKGTTIKLEAILDASIRKAREIIEKSETSRGLEKEEINDVSNKVGIGAIKYFDLMHQPSSDIVFDWNKVFVLEGNSGPYLQYTFARTNSILGKSKYNGNSFKDENIKLNNGEISVLRMISKFSNYLLLASESCSPNILCSYLFGLAQKYNTFYNNHKIIDGENEEFRVLLTKSVGQILKNGLNILGIETPTRM